VARWTLRITILAFDGMEALDFAGPCEVFTTAARMHQRLQPQAKAWCAVRCAARTAAPVAARAGLRVMPDSTFADSDAGGADVLLIPGGVVDAAMQDARTLEWIAKESARAGITASVCTGAFLLAASGVITHEKVTTHWEDVDDLRRQFPQLTVETGVRWVDQGRIVTSAGISAGIDMSLHLVARLGGMALAERTARQMDFAWTRN
jgi:transcriptional regulator GlxA family with amidase domain